MLRLSLCSLFRRQNTLPDVPFDPALQVPVIRSSICTGEKAAGFIDKKTGRFTEVMLIRSEKDRQTFMRHYGLKDIKTEY